MVTPMTVCPRSARAAAATAESTPPLMATRMVEGVSGMKLLTGGSGSGGGRLGAKLGDDGGEDLDHTVDVVARGTSAQAEADRGLRHVPRHAHREEHVGRMRGARLAGRAARDGDPLHVEREDQ